MCKKAQARLRRPAARRAAAGQQYDYTVTTVGSTRTVTVLVATALGSAGVSLGKQALGVIQAAYDRVAGWFGSGVALGRVTCLIAPLSDLSDGTGGAYHYSCADTVLYCDADPADPSRTLALFVAELSEVGQAAQGRGWDCGASAGEGLSRFHAEVSYPGALDDYETASAWLDGGRANVVDTSEATDQDDAANGCSVLFLYWLLRQGYTMQAITGASGSTLAAAYASLTSRSTAWKDFSAAVGKEWPTGKPSGVTSDNAWSNAPPPPPPPPPSGPNGPPPPPPPSGYVITIAGTGPLPTILSSVRTDHRDDKED
jgi:hypothetical protein